MSQYEDLRNRCCTRPVLRRGSMDGGAAVAVTPPPTNNNGGNKKSSPPSSSGNYLCYQRFNANVSQQQQQQPRHRRSSNESLNSVADSQLKKINQSTNNRLNPDAPEFVPGAAGVGATSNSTAAGTGTFTPAAALQGPLPPNAQRFFQYIPEGPFATTNTAGLQPAQNFVAPYESGAAAAAVAAAEPGAQRIHEGPPGSAMQGGALQMVMPGGGSGPGGLSTLQFLIPAATFQPSDGEVDAFPLFQDSILISPQPFSNEASPNAFASPEPQGPTEGPPPSSSSEDVYQMRLRTDYYAPFQHPFTEPSPLPPPSFAYDHPLPHHPHQRERAPRGVANAIMPPLSGGFAAAGVGSGRSPPPNQDEQEQGRGQKGSLVGGSSPFGGPQNRATIGGGRYSRGGSPMNHSFAPRGQQRIGSAGGPPYQGDRYPMGGRGRGRGGGRPFTHQATYQPGYGNDDGQRKMSVEGEPRQTPTTQVDNAQQKKTQQQQMPPQGQQQTQGLQPFASPRNIAPSWAERAKQAAEKPPPPPPATNQQQQPQVQPKFTPAVQRPQQHPAGRGRSLAPSPAGEKPGAGRGKPPVQQQQQQMATMPLNRSSGSGSSETGGRHQRRPNRHEQTPTRTGPKRFPAPQRREQQQQQPLQQQAPLPQPVLNGGGQEEEAVSWVAITKRQPAPPIETEHRSRRQSFTAPTVPSDEAKRNQRHEDFREPPRSPPQHQQPQPPVQQPVQHQSLQQQSVQQQSVQQQQHGRHQQQQQLVGRGSIVASSPSARRKITNAPLGVQPQSAYPNLSRHRQQRHTISMIGHQRPPLPPAAVPADGVITPGGLAVHTNLVFGSLAPAPPPFTPPPTFVVSTPPPPPADFVDQTFFAPAFARPFFPAPMAAYPEMPPRIPAAVSPSQDPMAAAAATAAAAAAAATAAAAASPPVSFEPEAQEKQQEEAVQQESMVSSIESPVVEKEFEIASKEDVKKEDSVSPPSTPHEVVSSEAEDEEVVEDKTPKSFLGKEVLSLTQPSREEPQTEEQVEPTSVVKESTIDERPIIEQPVIDQSVVDQSVVEKAVVEQVVVPEEDAVVSSSSDESSLSPKPSSVSSFDEAELAASSSLGTEGQAARAQPPAPPPPAVEEAKAVETSTSPVLAVTRLSTPFDLAQPLKTPLLDHSTFTKPVPSPPRKVVEPPRDSVYSIPTMLQIRDLMKKLHPEQSTADPLGSRYVSNLMGTRGGGFDLSGGMIGLRPVGQTIRVPEDIRRKNFDGRPSSPDDVWRSRAGGGSPSSAAAVSGGMMRGGTGGAGGSGLGTLGSISALTSLASAASGARSNQTPTKGGLLMGSGGGGRYRGRRDDMPRGDSRAEMGAGADSWRQARSTMDDLEGRPSSSHGISARLATMRANLTERQQTERQIRSILNKLTIERFGGLYEQLRDVHYKDMEDLRYLINLVCDKARAQHHFIPMYVELIKLLDEDLPDVITSFELQQREFRRLIVDICQQKFDEGNLEIKVDESLSEEDKFEQFLRQKKLIKGNLIFVGELAKKKMLAKQVCSTCVKTLLELGKDHHLEALCEFMRTIGGTVTEASKMKVVWDGFMTTIESLAKDENINVRIRCLLQDVVDDWKDGWTKALKDREGPKTLDQIQQEADADESMKRGGTRGFERPSLATRSSMFGSRTESGPSSAAAATDDDFMVVGGGKRSMRRPQAQQSAQQVAREPSRPSRPMNESFSAAGAAFARDDERSSTSSFLIGRGGIPRIGSAPTRFEERNSKPSELLDDSNTSGAVSSTKPIDFYFKDSPILPTNKPTTSSPQTTTTTHDKDSPILNPKMKEFDDGEAKEFVEAGNRSMCCSSSSPDFVEAARNLKDYLSEFTNVDFSSLIGHMLYLVADSRLVEQPKSIDFIVYWRLENVISESEFVEGFNDFLQYRFEGTKPDCPKLADILIKLLERAHSLSALSSEHLTQLKEATLVEDSKDNF